MDLELPTLQAIKQFVALGSGVALMPEITRGNRSGARRIGQDSGPRVGVQRKLRLIYPQRSWAIPRSSSFLESGRAVATERRGRYRFQRES